MELAIVILNYNGLDLLKEFLPGLIRHVIPKSEIIIADNGSADESVSWLRKNHPTLKIVELKQNAGFAEGYNQALKQIDSPYYLF